MSGLPTPVDPSDPRAGLADVTGQWTEMHNRCHELVAELRVRPAGDDTAPPAEHDAYTAEFGTMQRVLDAWSRDWPSGPRRTLGAVLDLARPAAGPRAGNTARSADVPPSFDDPCTPDASCEAGWACEHHAPLHGIGASRAHAGDAEPDDGRREPLWLRNLRAQATGSDPLHEESVRAGAALAVAEIECLRSEAAALRAAGDALADDVKEMLTGPVPRTGEWWSRLAPQVDAWRSAAGSPTAEEVNRG